MKMEDYMLWMVETYLNDTLTNLYEEQETCGFDKYREQTIKYLEGLTFEDLNKISERVFDNDVKDKIYENIDFYMYHYEKNEV